MCVLIVHIAAGVAHAQTSNDLQVRLGGYTSTTDGGEKPVGVWFGTGPVVAGEACDQYVLGWRNLWSFLGEFRRISQENATAAWKIDVTPTRVVRDAVTFRLRWQMAAIRQQGDRMSLEFGDAFPVPDEIELTLRPWESWPVYTLRNIHRYSCASGSSIRVSVDNYPRGG